MCLTLIPRLADRYSVVAPYLPGFGFSPGPARLVPPPADMLHVRLGRALLDEPAHTGGVRLTGPRGGRSTRWRWRRVRRTYSGRPIHQDQADKSARVTKSGANRESCTRREPTKSAAVD